MAEQIGYKIIGTIKSVEGPCGWRHKVGERFKISADDTGGLCNLFHRDIRPYISLLQFNGELPDEWEGEAIKDGVIELECRHIVNTVTIELRREK